MIIIKILSGPHAGKSRWIRDGRFRGREIDPVRLLEQLRALGSRWQIDFSRATENETIDWGRADMTLRYVRALIEGRPVFFQGVEYRAASEAEVPTVAQTIEDAIVTSGYHVVVEYDDQRGVSIATGPPEHRLQ